MANKIGKLIVITGETASGKDTVTEKLLGKHTDWKKIITTTTRLPRTGEKNHKDHEFITKDAFLKLKKENGFLETIEYAGNFYGTTKSSLDPVLGGKTLIWRIDISMASNVDKLFEKSFPKTIAGLLKANTEVIFLKLQDAETQKIRLQKRGMSEDDIKLRMIQDKKNLSKGHFKNIVINIEGQLENTIKEVEKIIKS